MLLVIPILILVILSETNALKEGELCTVKFTGITGTCRQGSNCPSAQRLSSQGIRPTICGYGSNRQPIVCCDEFSQPPRLDPHESNGNSFGNAEPDEGGLLFNDEEEDEQSISDRKCAEYSKPIRGEVQILPLFVGAEPLSYNITKCDYDGVALIIGGTPASLGEFPFMAAIGFRDGDDDIQWNCGGTLISERYVLSAAHCSNTPRFGAPVKVRLGDLDLGRGDEGAKPMDFDIERIIVHPNYKRSLKYNDIAIIKLNRNVPKFTKFIRPACLYNKFNPRQNTVVATGWGVTELSGEKSDRLLKVSLNIFPNSECSKRYDNSRGLPNGITKSMLCVGVVEGGRDTCQGDSGGPLLITKPDNMCVFYVVGITSFGKTCAAPKIPAVYTRVSEFVPWIERTIW